MEYFNAFDQELYYDFQIQTDAFGFESNDRVTHHRIVIKDYKELYKSMIFQGRYGRDFIKRILNETDQPFLECKQKITVEFFDEVQMDEIEEDIKKCMKVELNHKKLAQKLLLKALYRKAWLSASASIVCLFVVFFSMLFVTPENVAGNVIVEIIKVGSWMCMWQALLFASFTKAEHKELISAFDNLASADLAFKYIIQNEQVGSTEKAL